MAKLNPELAREIRRRAAQGERQKALAVAFNVTVPAISKVLRGDTYPDQPRPTRRPDPSTRRSHSADSVLAVLQGRSSALSPAELVETTGLSRLSVGDALRTFRRSGLIERLGSGHETGYRMVRATPAAPTVPRGDRPRTLGLRAAWLREHSSQFQCGDSTDQVTEAAS